VVANGREIQNLATVHILLNKPKDTISTVSDPRGRRTVVDLITRPELKKGLFPVGRLDRDTTGAIILTTDGDLANRLMHPSWEVGKIYVVETSKPVAPDELAQLRNGVHLEDGDASADNVTYPDSNNKKQIALEIHEGRNRQVRRMMAAIGHEVVHLERIQYAGLTLRDLKRGKWRRLTAREVTKLRKLVGLKLS
jgi:23S rRNA pseudouridine2605 synthase